MRLHSIPSFYLMRIESKDFSCSSLWQVRGYEMICVSADDKVSWMRNKRFADVIQRCITEKVSMTWIDVE